MATLPIVEIAGKSCTKCGVWHSIEHFFFVNRRKGWRHSQCRSCSYRQTALWRKNNPNKVLANTAARTRHDREKNTGVTPIVFDDAWVEQNGCCAICGLVLQLQSSRGAMNRACADHCHTSGKFRGLLCQGCNAGLGWFKDSPTALRKAAEYLEHN